MNITYENRGESIHCTSKMERWADRCVSIVEGGEGALPPPRNRKKDVVRRNFNLFDLCFTNEIRGDRQTLAAYMENETGWADRRLSIVGGGGCEGALPPLPPPLENEKKEAVRGNFNRFHLCFTNKIAGIDIHCIHAQWKGLADRRLSMVRGGEGLAPPRK